MTSNQILITKTQNTRAQNHALWPKAILHQCQQQNSTVITIL